MRSDTFDFLIPPERIAQTPAARRDDSLLLVVRRAQGALEHRRFKDLPSLLQPNDLLVLNDTRVMPCRLHGRREGTGGHVEIFVLRALSESDYEAITGTWGRAKEGMRVELPEGRAATLVERLGAPGHWRVRFDGTEVEAWLRRAAVMPLPPYIRREREKDPRDALDRERYQTVFAAREGAVAAPTAGLHFTPELLSALTATGVARTSVTLHVGPGTFRPLKADTLAEHPMHAEAFEVGADACRAVADARREGGRVIAVGTTACRTLETVSDQRGRIAPASGQTALFIYPPWPFRCTDALLTNFHLPRSTLIFLVAAWLGEELTRQAYEEALAREYRFFSYGDAMLCLP
jgi:S-adenosylmethionine:tRNA ribosyltransferase-isomerase